MKQFYRLAALFLALLLLCGCAAGNGYGKPERKEGQDQYLTDPVPEGKPTPTEPEDTTVDTSKQHTCTISIICRPVLPGRVITGPLMPCMRLSIVCHAFLCLRISRA